MQQDGPWRYGLAKGGEGGGKSVAGIVKTLERLRRGMHGIMVSPDFEHFKRSLWPEFARWCPWDEVVPGQRYRARVDWEPNKPFTLVFRSGGRLLCGGIEDPTGWEGPNVHFAHFDEARRHKSPLALKVLDGRCRLTGPGGTPPQLWLTTTPAMHWLYDYFGPIPDGKEHLHPEFVRQALVVDLLTIDNEQAGNLAAGYTQQRRSTLSEAEARVLLEAAWEETDTESRYLPSIIWWDGCQVVLPPLGASEPLVGAADAGVSDDSFGIVFVGAYQGGIAVRAILHYEPPEGGAIDFDQVEQDIRAFCRSHNVIQLTYDSYQLHQMMTRLLNQGVVWTDPFSQGGDRLEADKALLDAMMGRSISHDGDSRLRTHLDNANRKLDGGRLRIVKRTQRGKIDLAVALSMAHHRAMTEFAL